MLGRNFADNGLPEDAVAASAMRVFAIALGRKPSKARAMPLTDAWRHAAAVVIAYDRLDRPTTVRIADLAAALHRAHRRGNGQPPTDFAALPVHHRRAWAAAARHAAAVVTAHPDDLTELLAAEAAAARREPPPENPE